MNFWDCVYSIADNVGIPTTHIGQKLGLNRAYVSIARSNGVTPSLNTAMRILGVLGYGLAIVPLEENITPDNVLILRDMSDQDDASVN